MAPVLSLAGLIMRWPRVRHPEGLGLRVSWLGPPWPGASQVGPSWLLWLRPGAHTARRSRPTAPSNPQVRPPCLLVRLGPAGPLSAHNRKISGLLPQGPQCGRVSFVAACSRAWSRPRWLTWSLPPHSPAVTVGGPLVAAKGPAPPAPHLSSSPPRADSRPVDGQGLLLSRTMLGNHGLPYVGRFACGWRRLATTDPPGSRPSG